MINLLALGWNDRFAAHFSSLSLDGIIEEIGELLCNSYI